MTNPQLLLIAKAIIDSSKVTGRLMKADSINFLRTSSLTHNIVNSRFPQNHFQNDNYVPSKENKSTGTDKINKSDLADKTETNVATSTANLKPEDSPSNEHPKTTQAPREDLSKIDTLNNFSPPVTKAKHNVNKGNDALEDNHTLNTIDEKVTTNDQNPDASEENTRSSIPKDNVVNEPHKKADLKESYIPSTRASRIYHYGSLAAGLGVGAMSESFKRLIKKSDGKSKSPFLSEANIERLVEKLSKMRGAALKLGQMISIQDSSEFTEKIEYILSRVQNAANYMPQKQLYKVMEEQMGVEWESNFGSFDTIPFAAASIGQVHKATLSKDLAEKYGFSDVAVKVQYPGVSKSIDSDLSNLQSLLHLSKLLPKGMYLENSIRVARKELAWECDYLREAECNRKFVDIFTGSTVFKIPRVVNELSNSMVITTEFVNGDPISAVVNYDQETRDWVGTMIMELCLQELFVHKFMQTDPNWTNFLYDHSSRKIGLLDFGASRGYDVDFLDPYMQVLRASASSDRKSIAKWSEVLGFLTGYESQAMLDAHTDSVLELGKPFRDHGLFDFGRQQVTSNVKSNIPTMLNERLTPPPDETYSLHRKLSGAYLLCARIKARVPCRDLFFKYSDAYTVSQKYAA